MSVTVTKLMACTVLGWGDNVITPKINAYVVLGYRENALTLTKGNIYVVWQTPATPAGSQTRRPQMVQC